MAIAEALSSFRTASEHLTSGVTSSLDLALSLLRFFERYNCPQFAKRAKLFFSYYLAASFLVTAQCLSLLTYVDLYQTRHGFITGDQPASKPKYC